MGTSLVAPRLQNCHLRLKAPITHSLVAPIVMTLYTPMMSLSHATHILHEGTQLRDIFPVKSLKNA